VCHCAPDSGTGWSLLYCCTYFSFHWHNNNNNYCFRLCKTVIMDWRASYTTINVFGGKAARYWNSPLAPYSAKVKSGAIPSLPHMLLWPARRQLYRLLWNTVYKSLVTHSWRVHEYILSGQGMSRLSQNSEVHHVMHLCVCVCVCVCDQGREVLYSTL
jgi:hypothetical protein